MEWSFRIQEERKRSKTAYFVTLTYAPEHLPFETTGKRCKKCTKSKNKKQCHKCKRKEPDGKYKNWDGTLNPRDLTTFLKQLRKNQEQGEITLEHLRNGLTYNDKIKYYACGEYGELRGRPHMHLLIFNASRKRIEESWKYGQVHILESNEATISYLMKYLDKRLGKKTRYNRHPEFNTMSEGIGEAYIEKNKSWHKQNIDILYVTNDKGIRIPMPKYYRLQLFSDEERKEQVILVEVILAENKAAEIAKIGVEEYGRIQTMENRISELKFKKKAKKRNVD